MFGRALNIFYNETITKGLDPSDKTDSMQMHKINSPKIIRNRIMNKIYTFLIVIFSVTLGYAQCLDPVADAEQYFCTGFNITLDDLDVTVSGTSVWYEDAALSNGLPGTTPVVGGETYYVINDCGAGVTSGAVPITVYEQSVEFVVSSKSCVDLGTNVFFIEEDDLNSPIEIEVLNLDGNPFDEILIWSPVAGSDGYDYYHPLNPGNGWEFLPASNGQAQQQIPAAGFVFNHIRKDLAPFELVDLDLDLPVGNSGCASSTESITIIAGGLEYNEFCYGDTNTTMQDVEDHFSNIFDGYTIEWYDAEVGGTQLSSTDVVSAGTEYYIDLGNPTCSLRIPVRIEYKVPPPSSSYEHFFCSTDAWATLGRSITETLGNIDVCGASLKFYDSNFDEIANPANHALVDGETYYITDVINGCESAPLEITVTENNCGCSINTNFQNQDGTPDFRDIRIFQNPMSAYGAGFNVCNTSLLRTNQLPPLG